MNKIILSLLVLVAVQAGHSQDNSRPGPAPCAKCSEFDFWLGNWNLTWGDSSAGTNSIQKLLDGWVINENFEDPVAHYRGMSWSMYDTIGRIWKQTWVDNQGGYIILTGGFQDGEMTLSTAPQISGSGKKLISRMVFKHITTQSFDWIWSSSADGGLTWKINWQIHYQRKS